jgi:hypothetical protein
MLSNLWCEALLSWLNTLRRPGFALLAIITLSIGIGACAISFGLMDRLQWKPLPFRESSRVYASGLQTGSGARFITPFEYRELRDLEVVREIGLVSGFPREVAVQRGTESDTETLAPSLWLAVAATVCAVVALAALAPGLRAVRVSPMEALRNE